MYLTHVSCIEWNKNAHLISLQLFGDSFILILMVSDRKHRHHTSRVAAEKKGNIKIQWHDYEREENPFEGSTEFRWMLDGKYLALRRIFQRRLGIRRDTIVANNGISVKEAHLLSEDVVNFF